MTAPETPRHDERRREDRPGPDTPAGERPPRDRPGQPAGEPALPGARKPPRRPLGLPGRPRTQEWQDPAHDAGTGPWEAVAPVREPAPPVREPGEPAESPEEGGTGGRLPHQSDPAQGDPVQGDRPAGPPVADHRPGPAGRREPLEPAGAAGADRAQTPLKPALEAILMVVEEPVAEAHLADVLEYPRAEVALALRELAAEYTAQGRGFDLRPVAGGWRYYSRAACEPAVERFVLDGRQARLTQAALETLAVIAYRQPVSRSRVSAVRGVNCDGVMRTLVQRGLVHEAGSEPETGAILYRTTNYFLERMGLRGLDELPELAPFLPEVDDVEAESLEGTTIADAVAAAAAQSADRSGEAGQAASDR